MAEYGDRLQCAMHSAFNVTAMAVTMMAILCQGFIHLFSGYQSLL